MKFVIKGSLPGLNEYISAERSNRFAASTMKKQVQHTIALVCRAQHPKAHFTKPVVMHYTWYEKDLRRDCDNIAFAKKFIQDAFVNWRLWRAYRTMRERIRSPPLLEHPRTDSE